MCVFRRASSLLCHTWFARLDGQYGQVVYYAIHGSLLRRLCGLHHDFNSCITNEVAKQMICFVFRNHNPILSPILTNHRGCNTTGATSEAETADPSRDSKKQIEEQTIKWSNEKGHKGEQCNGRQRTTDN
jgi:hypothetical protein